MAVPLSLLFPAFSPVRSLQWQFILVAGVSGLDVPDYLEDIKDLEEALSPILVLTLSSRWCLRKGEEKGQVFPCLRS